MKANPPSSPLIVYHSKIPPSLLDLEKWVGKMTVQPLRERGSLNLPIYDTETITEIEKRISPSAHLSPAQSLGIYNQQYWFRFFTLAQENFPTLVRLFGYADFNQLIAEPAILKYPADHWALCWATAHLPRWIEEEYEGADKTFIFQIAQIDALYHNQFYAPALSSYDSTQPIAPKPFINPLKLNGNLLKFRNRLLEEPVEYWMKHPFPEIDFSMDQPNSCFQQRR